MFVVSPVGYYITLGVVQQHHHNDDDDDDYNDDDDDDDDDDDSHDDYYDDDDKNINIDTTLCNNYAIYSIGDNNAKLSLKQLRHEHYPLDHLSASDT